MLNLEGGIFDWHNDGRPLTDANGKTPYVHPYDDKWGQLLVRRDYVARTPRAGK